MIDFEKSFQVLERIDKQYKNHMCLKREINEAMGSDFSFEKLSSLSLMDALRYCYEKLGYAIGIGSSRSVFQIDDVQVLKIAGNDKGIAQNKVEAATKDMHSSLFPYIFYVDKDYKWIVTEFVLDATYKDFEQCIDEHYNDFFFGIIPAIKELKYQNGMEDFDKLIKHLNVQKHYGFYKDLAEYILNYDIPIADIQCIQNWGLAKRNGKERLVILDPGWNKETMQMYGCIPSI